MNLLNYFYDINLKKLPVMSLGMFLQLLIFLFLIYVFSSFGFIFNLKINIFYPIVSYIISCWVLNKFLSDKGFSLKDVFLCGIINFLIILLSFVVSSYFFDFTYDGRCYHQHAIILLDDGWNPVWKKIEKYIGNITDTHSSPNIWAQNYPKFCEIIAANFMKFTNKIEPAKAYQFITFFIVFFYSFYILNKKNFVNLKFYLTILLSLCISLNPVIISQFFTFYIDSVLCCFLTVLLLSIIDVETSENNKIKIPLLIFSASSICFLGIKSGSIFFIFVTFLSYFIYLYFQKNTEKILLFKKIVLVVALLGLVLNINPYIVNMVSYKRSPFYPLMGENKKDIMTSNTPVAIKEKNYIHKIFISIYSESVSGVRDVENFKLKIPFSFTKKELGNLYVDTRLGGFGVLFSGIFTLSLIMLFFIRYNSKEEKKLALLIYTIITLLTFLNPYSWWARYAPQVWLYPFITCIYFANSNKNNKIISQILVIFIFLCVVINSFFIFKNLYKLNKKYENNINSVLNSVKEKNLELYVKYETSFVQKLKENNIKFKLVDYRYYADNIDSFETIPYILLGIDKWRIK